MDILKLADKIEHILDPKPMCRDCADHHGRCPNSGDLCNPRDAAKELATAVRSLRLSKPTVYMGWTFEDVLHASRKLNIKLSCDDAEKIILKVSTNHDRYIGCNWVSIFNAVREHIKENKT